MLFDERFGCLEEEINKEAQTFIKVVGDFLANAAEVGFFSYLVLQDLRDPENEKVFGKF